MVSCHGVAVTFKSRQQLGQDQLSGSFTWNPHPPSWLVANSVSSNPHNWLYPCSDAVENATTMLCGMNPQKSGFQCGTGAYKGHSKASRAESTAACRGKAVHFLFQLRTVFNPCTLECTLLPTVPLELYLGESLTQLFNGEDGVQRDREVGKPCFPHGM